MMNSPEKKVDDDDVQSETSTEIAASWNTAQEGLLKGILI
jgi:hypothetical protein